MSVANEPMDVASSCLVGKYEIPLKRANWPTVVTFKAGEHGRREGGVFHFWTAVFSRPKRMRASLAGRRLKRRSICRSLAVNPPGERFFRNKRDSVVSVDVEDRIYLRELWFDVMEQGKNIAYIRPSTPAEVERWISTHEKDSRFIAGKWYRGEPWAVGPIWSCAKHRR